MKVFVTGASGWIGSAVVAELVGAGHQVVGLARSDASANAISAAGAEVVRGTTDDLDVLRSAAEASDGVINLAFNHDIAFSGGAQAAVDSERRAVEIFGDVLAGSNRPLVIASGMIGLKPGQVVTENDGHYSSAPGAEMSGLARRHETAEFTLALAQRGVRSSIVRLAPTNHGDGDNGFMRIIVDGSRAGGKAAYVGDGAQRWPAVHRLDSAHLFCLALEKAPAGSTLHANAEEGVAIRDIAEMIGRHLNLPVESVSIDEAAQQFGMIGRFMAVDSPVSSVLTRELMGWEPKQPGLLEDLDQGHYFKGR
ncbi:MAG TPA: SDR family oxidoreductase [Phototrophicaceae bacterium]|nr:SDR family oxidoreductase [Phototrophicaceae bacterium]